MAFVLIGTFVAVGIGLLFLLCLNGRHGNASLQPLQRARYAHRGLHGAARPENSLAAFRAAVQRGYGAELDVHLTKDGVPVVIHDTELSRVTGVTCRIDELTLEQTKLLRLCGTDEQIPTLQDVLAVYDGKQPLIIELKTDRGNAAALCEAVMRLLDGYHGHYALQSFDPRCLLWLKKHCPAEVRGQLAQNFHRSKDVSVPLRVILTSLLLNAFTRPDYIAYRFEHRRHIAFAMAKRVWKMPCAYWTLTTAAQIADAEADGAMPIFEQCEP